MMKLVFKKTAIKLLQNERGDYGFLELKDFIDYEAKRVYFIHNCHTDTGQHCHKIEKELFVMQKGGCTAVIDSGNGQEDVSLKIGDAIYVGSYVWHGFKNFSSDAILLAISSTNYNPNRSDYIENYDEYKKIIQAG